MPQYLLHYIRYNWSHRYISREVVLINSSSDGNSPTKQRENLHKTPVHTVTTFARY